jgi:hypothetical protein
MEKSLDREFRGIRLKIIRKLFNYDQKANSLAFRWYLIPRSSDFYIENRGRNFEKFNVHPN